MANCTHQVPHDLASEIDNTKNPGNAYPGALGVILGYSCSDSSRDYLGAIIITLKGVGALSLFLSCAPLCFLLYYAL